jgi:hypothetical protein
MERLERDDRAFRWAWHRFILGHPPLFGVGR